MQEEQNQIQKPIIGITHGDINGISYEIILKAFNETDICEKITPVIYGSPKVAAYYKKVMELNNINLIHVPSINEIDKNGINIINCVSNKVKVEIGKSTEMAGTASVNALRHSLIDLKNKKIDVIVTAPINKFNIQANDFNFKGHTDFFKHEFNCEEVLMFMVSDELKLALVTEHESISELASKITVDKIYSKILMLHHSLKRDFSISNPKIAVLGLNPHAGDRGVIGNEETEIIIPAIEKAKKDGVIAIGPFAADGFFGFEIFKQFDAVLAMYHDQGLVPFKLLAKGGGVNFTAGLPIVRTSPAHGTAYEIAGRNLADPKSFIESIYTAVQILKNRNNFDSIQPLQTNFEQREIETI